MSKISGEMLAENQTLQENNQSMQEEMARVWKENERLKEDIEVLNDRFYKMRKIKDEQFNSLYVKYTALLEYISLGYKLETPKIILENANGFNKTIVKEREDYKSRCEKASNKLGNYKHYSTSTEEQNSENEDIVDSALNILQNGSEEK